MTRFVHSLRVKGLQGAADVPGWKWIVTERVIARPSGASRRGGKGPCGPASGTCLFLFAVCGSVHRKRGLGLETQ